MSEDVKPNQAYLWSDGVYRTQPESISTQGYANLIVFQQKRITELEKALKEMRRLADVLGIVMDFSKIDALISEGGAE